MNFFKKFKYQYVTQIEGRMHWTDRDIVERITYVLLENGFGKRKLEVASYGYSKRYNSWKNIPAYATIIFPWLNGAELPEEYLSSKPTPTSTPKPKKKAELFLIDGKKKD